MSDKNKKIIICAGGTGGHVFPAKKLSEMLLKEAVEISWIGSSRGPEEQICKDLGIRFYRYPLTGFRGKSLFFKILSLIFLIFSFLRFFSGISNWEYFFQKKYPSLFWRVCLFSRFGTLFWTNVYSRTKFYTWFYK